MVCDLSGIDLAGAFIFIILGCWKSCELINSAGKWAEKKIREM